MKLNGSDRENESERSVRLTLIRSQCRFSSQFPLWWQSSNSSSSGSLLKCEKSSLLSANSLCPLHCEYWIMVTQTRSLALLWRRSHENDADDDGGRWWKGERVEWSGSGKLCRVKTFIYLFFITNWIFLPFCAPQFHFLPFLLLLLTALPRSTYNDDYSLPIFSIRRWKEGKRERASEKRRKTFDFVEGFEELSHITQEVQFFHLTQQLFPLFRPPPPPPSLPPSSHPSRVFTLCSNNLAIAEARSLSRVPRDMTRQSIQGASEREGEKGI